MSQDNANQKFDTKYRKIYVGDLFWETTEEGLRSFFEPFGEIIHANVVCNRETRRSEGYGFVTFRDAEAATRACENPNPIIDGRKTKCNLAYIGARVYNDQNQPNQNAQQFVNYPPIPNGNQFTQQLYPPGYQYPAASSYPQWIWTPYGLYYKYQPGL
ncbi:putative RNA-binding protein ARP1 [Cardamine amara subsp. amara]|uniref:RNA-binding protein ARP1 n=1 Tax=Cardamine amara subsp. amara TaxID=228776 RepID=A0ABD1B3V0_CARAN